MTVLNLLFNIAGTRHTLTEDGLYIRGLRPSDAGNYTCRAFVVTPHSSQMKDRVIVVHVHCTVRLFKLLASVICLDENHPLVNGPPYPRMNYYEYTPVPISCIYALNFIECIQFYTGKTEIWLQIKLINI